MPNRLRYGIKRKSLSEKLSSGSRWLPGGKVEQQTGSLENSLPTKQANLVLGYDLTELDTKYAGEADPALGHIPNDLIAAIQDVYKPAGMQLTDLTLRDVGCMKYPLKRLEMVPT